MRMFDRNLAERVEEHMGMCIVRNLTYSLSKEAVAVNENGTGFAEVSVASRDRRGHRDLTLMIAILKLEFVPDSAKLKSVMWHITEERFDQDANGGESDCPSSSSESLGCQTSFPSVVSLDQSGDASAEKTRADSTGEDSHGPGMHI